MQSIANGLHDNILEFGICTNENVCMHNVQKGQTIRASGSEWPPYVTNKSHSQASKHRETSSQQHRIVLTFHYCCSWIHLSSFVLFRVIC